MRALLSFTLALSISLAFSGSAIAKKKAEPLKPVTFMVVNQCEAAVAIKVGEVSVKVEPKATSAAQTLAGADGNAYTYALEGSKAEPRYVFLGGGGTYSLLVSNCIGADGLDLTTKDMSERPAGVSPNAAAKVRFRAASTKGEKLPNIQYQSGERGRFKRLSVGFTSYQEAKAGDYGFGLKLSTRPMKFQGRMMPGRQLQLRKEIAKLEPGKKYLIEAGVVGNKIAVKVEDEGWDIP